MHTGDARPSRRPPTVPQPHGRVALSALIVAGAADIAVAVDGAAPLAAQSSFFADDPRLSWVLAGLIVVLFGVIVLLVRGDLRRRRTLQALLRTEHRFHELVQNIPLGVWTLDVDTQQALFVNRAYAEILGCDTAALTENPNLRTHLIHPDDRDRVLDAMAHLGEPESSTQEYRIVRPDGVVRWVADSGFIIDDDEGRRTRIAGTTEDITERRATEAALRESQRAMSTLLSNLPGMAYRCRNDRDWTMEFVSEGCADLTGYPTEDLLFNRRRSYADIIHPDDRDQVWQNVQAALNRHQPFELNYRITTADGETRWVWEMGRGVFGQDDYLVALEGFIANDSERRRAQEALRESEQRYRTLVERSPIPIIIHTHERLTFANPAAAEALGAKNAQELLGLSIWDLAHPDYHNVVRERVGRIYAGVAVAPVLEEKFRRVDGETIDVEVSGATIVYGGVRASQVVFTDITKRKHAEAERAKLEAQLRQSQKMEAIGQLAGGVAHDFNNILTAVIGHLGLARAAFVGSVGAEHPGMRSLHQIERAADRAATLTRRLLTFSRKDVVQPVVLDLNALVNDSRSLLRRLITEDIELQFQLAPDLKRIVADANQIEQIILNLVVNARDAMPDGGKLTVKTSNALLDGDHLAAPPEAHPGAHVILTVSDTGCGIPPEVAERIFEPFFTTKEVGAGTGLGLAMVHGIVQQTGGHVVVYSEPGVGTTFRVCIPATDAAVTDPADGESPDDLPPTGTETILVCEDDRTVRELAARLLDSAGYEVLTAEHGLRALEIAAQHAGPIHLLLTDVIMPRMNGRQLAESLARVRPEVRILFTSGYTADVIAHRGVLHPDIEFLEKPFSRRDLLRRVRDALDGQTVPHQPH